MMEDSDSDSGSYDPVVRLRHPKNCTDVRTRHMALNSEGIRIVRDLESMIDIEKDNIETLQALLLVHMLDLGNIEDDSTG